jgi:hypothetical protein
MKFLHVLLTALFIVVLAASPAWSQGTAVPEPCSQPSQHDPCAPNLNLAPGEFTATPLIDGTGGDYGDPDHNIVSLYGIYGNNENLPSSPQAAKNHYQKGIDLAAEIQPRCTDGSIPPPNTNCNVGGVVKPPAIVFLFIGFSNCSIEICGGNSDIWDGQYNPPNGHLAGQSCATVCRNLNYPGGGPPWNQVINHGGDQITQLSFLYQVYPPAPMPRLVGNHVVVFNGAAGQQTLDHWDPTSFGFFAHRNDCDYGSGGNNPECNYDRVHDALTLNGYDEPQVQAIFLKSSNSMPQCDLKGLYCAPNAIPDAYLSEIYMGNILRYLKCCKLDTDGNPTAVPRYPNLKQVFITSRIYGGYGNGSDHGCLMPEPFAYEEGFAVQRMIVAQIQQANGGGPGQYAETVSYQVAPWFDWGPYLWASGVNISPGNQLNWCDKTTRLDQRCNGNLGDVRYGADEDPDTFWGDHIHPTYRGQEKVANQLVKFITGHLPPAQANISAWVTPWIPK